LIPEEHEPINGEYVRKIDSLPNPNSKRDLKIYLGSPQNWAPDICDRFLKKLYTDDEMRTNILTSIAKNDGWYNEVQTRRMEQRRSSM
jgi:hypothetical protein